MSPGVASRRVALVTLVLVLGGHVAATRLPARVGRDTHFVEISSSGHLRPEDDLWLPVAEEDDRDPQDSWLPVAEEDGRDSQDSWLPVAEEDSQDSKLPSRPTPPTWPPTRDLPSDRDKIITSSTPAAPTMVTGDGKSTLLSQTNSINVFSNKSVFINEKPTKFVFDASVNANSWLTMKTAQTLPPFERRSTPGAESSTPPSQSLSQGLSILGNQSLPTSAVVTATAELVPGGAMSKNANAALREASSFGLDQMSHLYLVQEPSLYDMGMTLRPNSAGSLLAAFNWQPESQASFSRYAYAALQASAHLRDFPHLFKLPNGGQGGAMPDPVLLNQCPLRRDPDCPGDWERFRTATGHCNNPLHPSRGAALMPFRRLLPAAYNDGLQEVRLSVTGERLASPRLISVVALRDPGKLPGDRDTREESPVSHLFMQWGQLVDHDITATPQSFSFNGSVPQCCSRDNSVMLDPQLEHPECLPIHVHPQDPHFGPLGVRCLQFVRSAPAPMHNCVLGPRQQANAVTGFLDASNLYASSQQRQLELRLFHQGLLNSMPGPRSKPMLPPAPPEEQGLCRRSKSVQPCLKSGDFRVNEQPGLTALHVLLLREHNRVAEKLRLLNAQWNDERIFQESRRVVVAELQHVTMTEFLPLVLGPDVMGVFGLSGDHLGYDPDIDATIPNAFSAAAFRFGHTLVQDTLWRSNAVHQLLPLNATLHEELAVAGALLGSSATERLVIGLSKQLSRNDEHHISRELTDHLFASPETGPGLDLAAINIQRGRDHGLPPYNAWRRPCGLRKLESFEDLQHVAIPRFAKSMPQLYNHVDDIDLYVGGIAEKPMPGGLVGPVFACIIGQTFSDLRNGDRFWYETQGLATSFSSEQLAQLRKVTLARLMCDNLEGARTVPRWPLRASPSVPNNGYIKCSNTKKIPHVNLNFWADTSDKLRVSTELPEVAKPPPALQDAPEQEPKPKPTRRPRPGNNQAKPTSRPGTNQAKPTPRPGNNQVKPTPRPNRRSTVFMKPIVLSNQVHVKPMGLPGIFSGLNKPIVVPNNVKPLLIPSGNRKPVALTNRNTTPQPIFIRATTKRPGTRQPNRRTTKAPGVHRVNRRPNLAMVLNLGNRNKQRPLVVNMGGRRKQHRNKASTTPAPAPESAEFKSDSPTPWPSLEVPTPINS